MSAGSQRKLPYSAAQPVPAKTPATLTGSVCGRVALIQAFTLLPIIGVLIGKSPA